ncbi:hypothetical protein O0I10_008999 [Lichtheimia ornata]|uniref:Uncharacterized protein n=1 Tax=Lichtheimia ornata TaxID=688661 RepID=A0AAD7XUU0_9FUNG|nr:uncharacterized protein O0I10_008999 [Lichtheimia ornata]KAJ8655310.1 hypothetical protein O0I10_008999 [Lichtheimia ornata]
MINRHPSGVLDAADVVRIDRSQRGLLRPTISHDVELLVTNFVAHEHHDYTDFQRAWETLQFYLIHFGAIEEEDRPRYLQAFYDAGSSYIMSDQPAMKIAAIYTLYFIYYSQPTCWKRFGIRVDPTTWCQLHDFYVAGLADTSTHNHGRAALAFKQMMNDDAFIFVVETSLKPVNPFEIKEMQSERELIQTIEKWRRWRTSNDAASAAIQPNQASQFKDVSDAYQRAKQLAIATTQAPIAAQHMLRRKTTVTERSRPTLQRILRNSSLGADENDFQQTLSNAARLLWKSRLKRLEKKPLIFNAPNRQRPGPGHKKRRRSQPQPVADAADTPYSQQEPGSPSSSSSSIESE